MKSNVPVLNILIGLLYLALSALTAFVLKLACRSRNRPSKQLWKGLPKLEGEGWRVLVRAWALRYTLIGSAMNADRQYFLKQLLLMGFYALTTLYINQITLLPVVLSMFFIPLCYLQEILLRFVARKCGEVQVKPKVSVDSEIHIDIGTLEEEGLRQEKRERSLPETLFISTLAFLAIVAMLQATTSLCNSVSNMGQLNILSLLAIVGIDQIGTRPVSALLFGGVCYLLHGIGWVELNENTVFLQICEDVLLADLQERHELALKKQRETLPEALEVATNGKQASAIKSSGRGTRQLNLLEIQLTKREVESKIDEVYLTSAEKEIFSSQGSGHDTLRRKAAEQAQICVLEDDVEDEVEEDGVTEGVTIHYNDLQKHRILNQLEGNAENTYGHLKGKDSRDFSPSRHTRRKMALRSNKKVNRRVLLITGNSPYLQYLPDMLKNVDKAKKDAALKQKKGKIL